MSIEKEEAIVDSEENNEEVAEETTEETPEEKPKVEKPKRTPEEELEYFEGRAARIRTKLGLDNPEKDDAPRSKGKTQPKSDEIEFNNGDKALLRAYDIKTSDEIALAKSWMKRTGDQIEVMAEDDIFRSKLTKLREAKATNDALPKNNRRGNPTPSNDESAWAAKIESGQATLADIPDRAMREKVLDKRIEKEKSGSKFAPQGIIMNN